MVRIEVKCDRCGKIVDGGFDDHSLYGYTAGYYTYGDCWSKFMNKGERNVCDDCIFKDPRYIKVYGKVI